MFETQGQLWRATESLEVVRASWVQMRREGSTWWLYLPSTNIPFL